MESKHVISLATIADAASIVSNNLKMAKESEGLELEPAVLTKGIEQLLEDSTKGHYYVIKGEDGAVIGQLMITYEWSDWRASQIWWIQSVYVSEDRRRQGLFRSLYAHAKSESQKAGACGLRLYADNDNVKAQTTYTSLGMVSHYKVFEDMNTAY